MGFSRQEYWSGLPFPSPNVTVACLKCWDLRGRQDKTAGWHPRLDGVSLGRRRELVQGREPGALQSGGRRESGRTQRLSNSNG